MGEIKQKINVQIKEYKYGKNIVIKDEEVKEWPVTYLIHNSQQIYVGETVDIEKRLENHINNVEKQEINFTKFEIIYSDTFNKSAIYLIETMLMRLISADKKLKLVNKKTNQKAYNFYQKEEYEGILPDIWKELKNKGLVQHEYDVVVNSEIFKYSPFTNFTDEQIGILNDVLTYLVPGYNKDEVLNDFDLDDEFRNLVPTTDFTQEKSENLEDGNAPIEKQFFAINGGPGTGKSLLMVKFIYELVKNYNIDPNDICVVHNIDASKSVVKKVIKGLGINGISYLTNIQLLNMNKKFKYIFVDEGQRTYKYNKKQANFLSKLEKLGKDGLDVILDYGNNVIFMYDERQSIRCGDIDIERLQEVKKEYSDENYHEYKLTTYFRTNEEWDDFIYSFLTNNFKGNFKNYSNYNFKLCGSIKEMHDEIIDLNKKEGLSRMVSGFSRPWESKVDKSKYEFIEDGYKAQWNTKYFGWFDDENSVNEIGSVFTIAGIDLNYCGVIIGKDLYYDKEEEKIKCDVNNFFDTIATPVQNEDGTIDEEILFKNIVHAYYILLTRGIKGTFIYIEDDNLREYFKKCTNK